MLIIMLIPWIRQEFSDSTYYHTWSELFQAKFNSDTFQVIIQAFPKSNNIIKLTQIYFAIKIIVNIFGNTIQKVFYMFIGFLGRIIFSSE